METMWAWFLIGSVEITVLAYLLTYLLTFPMRRYFTRYLPDEDIWGWGYPSLLRRNGQLGQLQVSKAIWTYLLHPPPFGWCSFVR